MIKINSLLYFTSFILSNFLHFPAFQAQAMSESFATESKIGRLWRELELLEEEAKTVTEEKTFNDNITDEVTTINSGIKKEIPLLSTSPSPEIPIDIDLNKLEKTGPTEVISVPLDLNQINQKKWVRRR